MFKNLCPIAIGIHAGMRENLKLAKSVGFDGLDLDIDEANKLTKEHSIDYVKDLWSESGLKMGGWGFPLDWGGGETEFQKGLKRFPEQAELAADLGCHRTTTQVFNWSNAPFNENWDFHIRRLKPAAEILKHYGHSLGLEFIGPAASRRMHRFSFAYDMNVVLDLAATIGTGNVGLLFDTWHWYTCRSTLDDVRGLTKNEVIYVQVNDAPRDTNPEDQLDDERCLPGETGVIPVVEILQILNQIGCDGPVTPEPCNDEIEAMPPNVAAKVSLASLDKVWDQATG
ncbi:MAG: sugar phosphate isomerase/epimerase [Candidatus Poribacteria bacterium]|nr:sugar phosphate isomerase/epimerase [Candidatus Poribacteria bacterium]